MKFLNMKHENRLEDRLIELIENDYTADERASAQVQLESIQLHHVMANSTYNLLNARVAVLQLAKGKLDDLSQYVEAAKTDFRDVILWQCKEKSSFTA